MVKLWDVRVASLKSVMEVNHGKPVDSINDKSRCIWVFIGLWGENDWEFVCGDVCREEEDGGEYREWFEELLEALVLYFFIILICLDFFNI